MHPPAESLLEASGQLQPAGPTAEDRLAVLERIVTDKSYNLADEIEALRDRKPKLEDGSKTP